MDKKKRVEKIRCDEPNCTTIVAVRRLDETIVIRSRHHGETHITIIEPWPSAPRQDLDAVVEGGTLERKIRPVLNG
ncbi:MAG TPA: hypothetical protein VIC84_13050 [Blastocatellia bacterium]|jgi:hypothetical protein